MNNSSNLKNNFLPTRLSQPQPWEKGELSLLPLRETASASGRSNNQTACRQVGLLLALLVLSVFGYYLVSRHVATTVIVQGRSMTPTLQDGDRFILNRLSYFRRSPQRGDLVVVKDPGHKDYAVKRIVALPCESIFFKRGDMLVNGKHLLEPYLPTGTRTFLPDSKEKLIVIGKDHYFVMGDNRGNSEDSRYYGAVHKSQIIGSISK